MVKVTGPAMSMGASGTIAGTMTFATWKGRPYVRQTVRPANPQSPGQTNQRAWLSWVTRWWGTLDAADKAAWTELADQGKFSAFNAFVKFNLANLKYGMAPRERPNVYSPEDVGEDIAITATGIERAVSLEATATAALGEHAIAFARRPTADAIAPGLNDVIAVVAYSEGGALWTDRTAAPGVDYTYSAILLAPEGGFYPCDLPANATPL